MPAQFSDAIFQQWQRFQRNEDVDLSVVKPYVYDSWLRSRRYGIEAENVHQKHILDADLPAILARHANFIENSEKIMEKLFKSVEAADSVISLADTNGVIIHTHFQTRTTTTLPTHRVGSISTEEVGGTNSIGTCLYLKKPVELVGAEHYCLNEHIWYCSAAPILDSKSHLLGVFNISIPKELFHHHTSGMVEAAAHAISEQMYLRELISEQSAIMDLIDEGVILCDNSGIIKSINKKALTILNLSSDASHKQIDDIFQGSKLAGRALTRQTRFTDEELTLYIGNKHRSYLVSSAPTSYAGAVFTIRDGSRIRDYAVRVAGSKASYSFDQIVGESQAVQQAINQGLIAAGSDITTLICGASGTGKELFAQAIHNAGARARFPFIAVNCGAIPRNLVQSELFGYEAGAFTGASRKGNVGKFELADKGTLFLDEISEMPLDAQVSLLRFLQNREFMRIGGAEARNVNVRVIAATNRNLEDAVAQNVFRQDLFYRLNAFLLEVPSLLARKDDIPILAQYFIRRMAQDLKKNINQIEPSFLDCLCAYAWPGNVRELENAMERAVNVCTSDTICIKDLPPHIQAVREQVPQQGRLRQQEVAAITQAIHETRGNLRQAAQMLGIARSTLYIKMKQAGIARNQAK